MSVHNYRTSDRIPKPDKYPYYSDYLDWCSFERERIEKCMKQLKPYLNIVNIEEIKRIKSLYSLIFSNHKTMAVNKFYCLELETIRELPKWVRDYVHKSLE